jgi:hypothetical protein
MNLTPFHLRIVWFFPKVVNLNVVHPLKIYQVTIVHASMLTAASFAFSSERLNVRHFEMVEASELKVTASRSSSVA